MDKWRRTRRTESFPRRRLPDKACLLYTSYREVHTDEELLDYEEIVITGGEPMLIPGKVLEFINRMWDKGYRGKMYLYTSYWNGKGISKEILKELDGFTFTLHAECTDADIIALKNLSNSGVLQDKGFSSRLVVDKRVYDRYDPVSYTHLLGMLKNGTMKI